MRKRYDKKGADKRLRNTMIRNWIICGISLVLIVICYYWL